MTAANSERVDAKTKAIEDALSRLGEPVTEAQAKALAAREDCECKEGMFALAATRRGASYWRTVVTVGMMSTPSFTAASTDSKWWCNGTIRKTRLPVVRNETIWITQVVVMMTKSPPIMIESSVVRVATASPPIRPPSPSEPTSPMKIRAGDVFHHRKPTQAPAAAAAIMAISRGSRTW